MGVVVRRYIYRFHPTIYLSLLLLYLFFFAAAFLLFVHFLKCFSFLFQYFLVIKFYVLNNFSRSINTYGQLWVSHSSHMKASHDVLYMKKHTQTYASYPAMDISCMTSRSVV